MMDMQIRKYLRYIYSAFLALSILLLVFAVIAYQEFAFTGVLFGLIGVIQGIISALALIRLSRSSEELKELGKVGIQHAWTITSVGLAGAALFLAPFFDIGSPVISYTAFVIALLFLLLGTLTLYKTRKDTGQFLSI